MLPNHLLRTLPRAVALSKLRHVSIRILNAQSCSCVKFLSSAAPQYESPVEAPDDLADEHIFTEQHLEFRRNLRKIIENDINPFVDQWEHEKQFSAHGLFKKLGRAGFLGVNRPLEYGGLGLDYSYNVAINEEFGSIRCGGIPMAIAVQTDVATPALAMFGSKELKEQFLAPSIAGDFVGCLGVSEIGAGSDVANITTTAVKDGDDYIINGGKMWTTNGAQADWMCILANTSEGEGHFNKSLIIVPMRTPGVTVAKKVEKLGMLCSDTVQTYFEDVRVPQKYRIGAEGKGFIYQMIQFQEERLAAGALSLLPLERAINETASYCSQRKIFGKPILDNQVVHFRLAELQTEVELVRSLLYRATGLYVQGKNVTRLVSMLKLKAARVSREVTDACLQYWGGMGYTDIEISRGFRDSRLLSIGGGADEVMLAIICKYMGTLPK